MENFIRNKHDKLQLVRTLVYVVIILLAVGLTSLYLYKQSQPAQAATSLTFSVLGTHPEASAQPVNSGGRAISDLIIKDDKIYMGYGDYDANTGPIHINPYNISTGSFEGSQLSVPTEEIDTFRLINDKIYAPMIDPKIGWTSNVGYAEMASDGTWTNQLKAPAVHVYDMATLDGNDLWMVGSSVEPDGTTERGATAYRSTDGGNTWSVVMTDASTPTPNGYERYYWIAELNGRVYMQAMGLSSLAAPIRSFDGTNWYEQNDVLCPGATGSRVVVFADNIVCPYVNDGSMQAFDGININVVKPAGLGGMVLDLYIDGSYLYALGSNGSMVRTTDLVSWESLGTVAGGARSIAIQDDYMYIGDQSSRLLRSDMTITEALSTEFTYSPEACFGFNPTNGTITDYFDNQASNPANPACPRSVDIPSTIGGVAVTTIGYSAFKSKQLTSVTIPDSVTSIGVESFTNNQLISIIIPGSVSSIDYMAFRGNKLESVIFNGAVATFSSNIFDRNIIKSITYGGTEYNPISPVAPECFTMSANAVTGYKYADMNTIKNQGIGCLSLDIDIPATIGGVAVTSISASAFAYDQLTSVTIPNSVTSIGGSAFTNNQLTSVTIPNSVTSIGSRAFNSNQLTSVNIGNLVDSIGSAAFEYNQLTSVTIPNSVTSIGNSAFYGNQLTSVTLPNSITSIGDSVFALNSLKSVNIPGSVQSIHPAAFVIQNQWGGDIDGSGMPHIYSYDKDVVQAAYDGMWYVRLITEDPSNPNNLTTTIMDENSWIGSDKNGDGINNSIGGYIVNPAQLTTNYRSSGGDTLKPSQTYTGIYNGEYLTDYMVSNGPVIDGPGDMAAIDASYYHIGDSLTLTPPAISGYLAPPTATFALASSSNDEMFVYQALSGAGESSAPGTSTNDGSGKLANTGFNVIAMAILMATMTLAGVAMLVAVVYRRRA